MSDSNQTRASEWDTTQFLWSGRLRVIAVGDECALHLEDPVTGELFAKCPYDLEGTAVEPVIDSSRYFVIRVVDPTSGSHAFLGLGVAERSWAFDLNVALQDHTNLKEGQMIQMNLGISQKKHNALDETTQSKVPTEWMCFDDLLIMKYKVVKLQPPQKPASWAVAQVLPPGANSNLLDPLAYAALITWQPCPNVNNSALAQKQCSYPATPTSGQVQWTCEAGDCRVYTFSFPTNWL
ncbi:hypothetical protein BDEG_22901 [Batrachochytrium dendrobatidis JEL423]|uniref:NECAP PHear domain-containing protein n=1 Tax=Batrachochytrium dendrobatidis (strain JEL423) TaxID=403673 RepID=A0A177WI40_BATDL|nr:hypothetical protein BDEG_22901 [Batrachochytrium dendrobatidis JEL423]